MEQTIALGERIKEIFANDPLYQVIKETPTEELFLSESYLSDLIEKKYYSTPEVASWFEVTDAQLRYYIKPFEEYLFNDEASNPTTGSLIRLDYKAVLKLRMILLLKDEYRVKGLKQLLRMNEDGHIIKKTPSSTEFDIPNDIEYKLNAISQVLDQVMKTGLFVMEPNEETQQLQLTINQDFLEQKIKAIPSPETSERFEKIQETTRSLEQENAQLKEMVEGIMASNKKDIAIRIREKTIEQTVLNRLQNEAEQHYLEQKTPLFRKLFHSAQIEVEKKRYITTYIELHYSKQLTLALHEYHKQSLEYEDDQNVPS